MKRIPCVLVVGLAVLLIAPKVSAAFEDNSGAFLEMMVGKTNWNIDRIGHPRYPDDDTGGSASFGYRWSVSEKTSLGFEAGYAKFPLITDTASNSTAFFGYDTVRGKAIKLGANLQFVSDKVYFEPRAGLMRASFDGQTSVFLGYDSSDFPEYRQQAFNESKTGYYLGFGVGFLVSRSFAVSFNVDKYFSDTTLGRASIMQTTLGLQYRF